MRDSVTSTTSLRVRKRTAHLLAFGVLMAAAPALAGPPAGLLTAFEEKRHDIFVETARSGSIDLLFIGDSATEFWLAEGRSEWDRNFAGLKAANFGVQGADTESLRWRLQNGELDGFSAKVIVLDALLGAGDPREQATEAEILAGNAAIVAEIRKRQPQARIVLLVAPRMRSYSLQAALRRHFAELADGSAIQYLDVTSPFAAPGGGFDTSMGSGRGSALSQKGYAALAQAMKPKLTELLTQG